MAAKTDFSKAGFLKSYLLPALIAFLIPGFGLWFFNHVEADYDAQFRKGMLAQIEADKTLTPKERENGIKFAERVTVSDILAANDPEAKDLQNAFSAASNHYAIFRWMKRIAWTCLLTALGAMVVIGAGLKFAAKSQNALYWNLRVGWNVLRWFAVLQVVGQGTLAVALSFWVTAFWMEFYSIKLIGIIGILAICGVGMLIAAIFRKLPEFWEFEGTLLKKEAAPALWQRVADMAARLKIAPPDQIFVGIDDNFFVTEHQVKVGGQLYNGRTLFASLSLLKTLSRSEADAVLAHELGHFSGEDTVYSKRISPLLGKYGHYLEALHQGGLSKPVFHFMFFFWNLYQMALSKISREREFRADRIGAELTSPGDIARSLVKIAAYCQYRFKVQSTLFETDASMESMDVFQRIEHGFPKFMSESVQGTELGEAGTPHPFDTHPPLQSRLQSMGFEVKTALKTDEPLPAPSDTWFTAIDGAAEMEAAQWKAFEDEFQKVHQTTLAWRFKPQGEAEIAHELKFFPGVQFTSKKGITATLDYEKLNLSDWEVPLYLATIKACRLEDALGGQQLMIDYKHEGESKLHSMKIKHREFPGDGVEFLQTFEKYYGRSMTSKQYHEEKAKAKEAEKAGGEKQTPTA
ncbi:MAG: M48 family metallopeptidase [Verrucomicrobiota bacterium]